MVEATDLFSHSQKLNSSSKPSANDLLEDFKYQVFNAFDIQYPFGEAPEDISIKDEISSEEAGRNDEISTILTDIEEELAYYINTQFVLSHPVFSIDEGTLQAIYSKTSQSLNKLLELNPECTHGEQTEKSIAETLKSSLAIACQKIVGRTNVFEPPARGR